TSRCTATAPPSTRWGTSEAGRPRGNAVVRPRGRRVGWTPGPGARTADRLHVTRPDRRGGDTHGGQAARGGTVRRPREEADRVPQAGAARLPHRRHLGGGPRPDRDRGEVP